MCKKFGSLHLYRKISTSKFNATVFLSVHNLNLDEVHVNRKSFDIQLRKCKMK